MKYSLINNPVAFLVNWSVRTDASAEPDATTAPDDGQNVKGEEDQAGAAEEGTDGEGADQASATQGADGDGADGTEPVLVKSAPEPEEESDANATTQNNPDVTAKTTPAVAPTAAPPTQEQTTTEEDTLSDETADQPPT